MQRLILTPVIQTDSEQHSAVLLQVSPRVRHALTDIDAVKATTRARNEKCIIAGGDM